MSEEENGDANANADADAGEESSEELTVDALRDRLAAIEERLDAARTEADLDEVEEEMTTLESDLEAADLPEPDDEDEEDPQEALESNLDDLQSGLEEARGPYAEDVVSEIDDAKTEIAETRWTEQGEAELEAAVESFLDDVGGVLDESYAVAAGEDTIERLTTTLADVAADIEAIGLDPDDDSETIAALLEAAAELTAAVEDAQTWDDLSVRQQLEAQGYYDVLDHVKDYPPEWHALKVHEKRGNVEMILLALETFDSDFMEKHALDAFERKGPEEALEPMLQRAGKRDKRAITILGKIAKEDEEVVETLLEYVDADSDPLLQKVTFTALGEIGAGDAVQPLANKLAAENPEIRSQAARALGLLGDTRAIDPLADVLADDDEDTVRASAAWALNQIGTEEALGAVVEYTDDRAYLVQAEAEKAV